MNVETCSKVNVDLCHNYNYIQTIEQCNNTEPVWKWGGRLPVIP